MAFWTPPPDIHSHTFPIHSPALTIHPCETRPSKVPMRHPINPNRAC